MIMIRKQSTIRTQYKITNNRILWTSIVWPSIAH